MEKKDPKLLVEEAFGNVPELPEPMSAEMKAAAKVSALEMQNAPPLVAAPSQD